MGMFTNDQQALEARVNQLEQQVAELTHLVHQLQAANSDPSEQFQQPTWMTEPPSGEPQWLAEVRATVAGGKKIDAIRRVMQYTGWTLAESKDYVDGL